MAVSDFETMEKANEILDNQRLDWEKFMSFPETVRSDYVYCHANKIIDGFNERNKECITSQMDTVSLYPCPDRFKPICGDWYYTFWNDEVMAVSKKVKFQALIFSAIRVKNISCHEMLFGCHTPAKISSNAAMFLDYMKIAPSFIVKITLSYLKENQKITDSPWYVFQTRLKELMHENGYHYDSAMKFKLTTSRKNRARFYVYFRDIMMMDFTGDNKKDIVISPQIDTHSISNYYLLMLACAAYDTSVDKFLLQDYSDFAVMKDGTPLTKTQRERLSIFLCASNEAQQEVLEQYIDYTLSQPLCWN